MSRTLGLEKAANGLGFMPADVLPKSHEHIWLAEVSVELGDFVLQNEVVSKSIPGKIGKDPVVLVAVIPIMSEYQVRLKLALELLEKFFDFLALEREEAAPKVLDQDLTFARVPQELLGTRPGFLGATTFSAKDYPEAMQTGHFPCHSENRSSAADLDIIGVRPEQENALYLIEVCRKHRTLVEVFYFRFQTSQGALP
jgi:hypothetical protein